MKEDILFRNADLIKLALDDLIDQKNFFRKILLRERFFLFQKGISAKGQEDTEEEGEKVTDPTPRSPSPVWLFSHLTLHCPTGNARSSSTTPLWGDIPAKAHGLFPSAGIKPLREF